MVLKITKLKKSVRYESWKEHKKFYYTELVKAWI